MMSEVWQYWCYSCEKYINPKFQIYSCINCDSEAIELNDNTKEKI